MLLTQNLVHALVYGYHASARAGWPSVSMLSPGDMVKFYLNVRGSAYSCMSRFVLCILYDMVPGI